MYRMFDKHVVDSVKKQLKVCFEQGVLNEPIPKSLVEARERHKKNVESLEQVIDVFEDMPKSCTMRRLKQRLENEKLWLKHYENCAVQHKKGRDRLTQALKGADWKVVVELIVKEEEDKSKKTYKVIEPKSETTSNNGPMLAKQVVPGSEGLRGAARRRFFLDRGKH